jgi:hypothetical protein
MSILVRRFLKIDLREVKFERREFVCSNPAIQARLENIGGIFLQGYHAALQNLDHRVLAENLNQVDQDHRGFAYEGAAMALALMETSFWKLAQAQFYLALRRNVQTNQ